MPTAYMKKRSKYSQNLYLKKCEKQCLQQIGILARRNQNIHSRNSEHLPTDHGGIPALIVQLGIKQHLEYAIPFGKLTVCYWTWPLK